MKKNDIQIGMRVGVVAQLEETLYGENAYNLGVVESFSGNKNANVKWDGQVCLTEMNIKDLLTETDAKTKGTKLEKEFKKVSEAIGEQMNIAADALRAAGMIALKHDIDLSMIDASSSLLNAMDSVGWNTSSLSC